VTDPKKTPADFDRMAAELEAMAETVRMRPDPDHALAKRLSDLAKEMRANQKKKRPGRPTS
jgi:hypothetical protein